MCEDSKESVLHDDNDKLLYDAIIKSKSDPNCILNGTKYKLIYAQILNEPWLSVANNNEPLISKITEGWK